MFTIGIINYKVMTNRIPVLSAQTDILSSFVLHEKQFKPQSDPVYSKQTNTSVSEAWKHEMFA